MSQVQYQAFAREKEAILPIGRDECICWHRPESRIALGPATTSLPDVHLHITRAKQSIDAFKKRHGAGRVEVGALITWPQDHRGEWITADEIRACFDKLKMPA